MNKSSMARAHYMPPYANKGGIALAIPAGDEIAIAEGLKIICAWTGNI
jgi:hypothetical protein